MKWKSAILVLGLIVMTAPSQAVVVTFENGVNAYSGAHHAMILADLPDANCVIGIWGSWLGIQTNMYTGLIRFDGLGIPTGSTINSATLNIVNADTWAGQGPVTVKTVAVLKDWYWGTHAYNQPVSDGEVTWNSVAHNVELWEVPGANGATDVAPIVDPGGVFTSGMASINLDVAASLQQQVNGGNIYGWALKGMDNPGQLAIWDVYAYDSMSSSILTIDYTPIPEPGSLVALCGGLVGLVGFARRRRS